MNPYSFKNDDDFVVLNTNDIEYMRLRRWPSAGVDPELRTHIGMRSGYVFVVEGDEHYKAISEIINR